ncbi:MAG TPA: metallophosphoesterase [Verrucomicrobiae bacterium]|nr:metallophosphoesterase [Verrucomicrobiae bacterium]
MPQINRRKFLRLGAATGVAALGADSLLVDPNFPQVVERTIKLRRWPQILNGFRIALLSDFHYDPVFSVRPLHAAIPKVRALNPDLIVLTGDFVSLPVFSKRDAKAAMAAYPCAEVLRQMRAPHGLWAVLGNHDFYTDPFRVAEALRANQIRLLENSSAPIEANGARFWLAGVTDVLSQTADLNATLHDVPANEATILLAHEPDYADYVSRFPVDLQLSGHSHGGQVRLPLLPPLYLPELAKKYIAGFYRIGPLSLYTNRGLGTVGLPVRFDCSPEITLLTLHQETLI